MAKLNGKTQGARLLKGSEEELLGAVDVLAPLLRENTAQAVVQVTGPSGGEGASTIALSFAHAVQHSLGEPAFILRLDKRSEASASEAGPAHFYEVASDEDRRAIVRSDLARVVQRKANNCRIFIIDCEPLLTAPISGFVAGQVDGTILVMESERTPLAELEQAQETIKRSGGRILGVLVNKRRRRLPRFLAQLLGAPRRVSIRAAGA